MRQNIKITLIERHEIACNLLIPKTLIFAPRQSGKTTGILQAIKEVEYYKVFVANQRNINGQYSGLKNIHLGKDFKNLDIDSIAWKVFVDDIEFCGEDPHTKIPNITLETSRIYSATTSILNFDEVQLLSQVNRFNFDRICIVDGL